MGGGRSVLLSKHEPWLYAAASPPNPSVCHRRGRPRTAVEWYFCPHFKPQPHRQPGALRRSCFPRVRRLRALSGIRLFSKEQARPSPAPGSRHRARCSRCCWPMQRERQEPCTATATLHLTSKLFAAWQRRGDAPRAGSPRSLQTGTGEAPGTAAWQSGCAVLCLPRFSPLLLPCSSISAPRLPPP